MPVCMLIVKFVVYLASFIKKKKCLIISLKKKKVPNHIKICIFLLKIYKGEKELYYAATYTLDP